MKTIVRLAIAASLLVATAANAQNGYSAAGYYAAPQAQAAYAQQQAANAQAWAAYHAQQANAQAWSNYYAQQAAAQRAAAARPSVGGNSQIRFDGRFASLGQTAPQALQFAVYAANTLQNKPYVLGGGHRNIEDSAYDCSSSTSYILIKAGLLNRCLSSKEFANYGQAGEGRFITIWVKPGEHVFMTICGLRMDTSGQVTGEGPRWRTKGRSYAGFSPRHPVGL
ncbi:MAG: peptidoglycan endopeptidase [Verrucomicrobia bacterium]|nr:peptidoglycan endopeptidase [Verrucomicrobiota bacterium]